MKFSTNTAYILSASLFATGMVGTLAWTRGGGAWIPAACYKTQKPL